MPTISPTRDFAALLRCIKFSGRMSEMGLVSRVTPVQTAMRNCTRDEGRSFLGIGTRSGTVSSVAIASVLGGLAIIKAAYQYIATTRQLESR
jgi:hypothetical protein